MLESVYGTWQGRPFERRLAGRLAVLAMILLVPTGSVLAGPSGELDASFGDNGRVRLEGDTLWHFGIGHAIAEQTDGKLLLAGEEAYEGDFLVYRLNADGSLDETFGDAGSVQIDFHADDPFTATPWGEATTIAVQPDGRIVVGGRADSSYGVPPYGDVILLENVGLIRLNSDGTLDSSFGDNGRVVLDLGGRRDYLSDLVLLPTGEIVIAGYTDAGGDLDAVFARLTPNGALDPAFGSGPVSGMTIVRSSGHDDRPQALVRQTDGSLVACGESVSRFGVPATVMSAARVFANGSIDTGFGVGGLALVGAGASSSVARDCLALPDGTLLLAGYGGEAGAEDMQLAWLGTDGRLATQHGQQGLTTVDFGASESIQGVTTLVDGTIAVTGLTGIVVDYSYLDGWWVSPFPSTQPSGMLFARLDRYSGQLDTAFGEEGITFVDFGRQDSPSWVYGRSITATGDGKLVAVGTVVDAATEYPDFAVARIDPAGPGNLGLVGFITTDVRAYGAARAVAEVRRTGGSSGSVMADYRTVSGTAMAPQDYTAASGTLVWNDGDTTTRTIEIPLHGQQNPYGSSPCENSSG